MGLFFASSAQGQDVAAVEGDTLSDAGELTQEQSQETIVVTGTRIQRSGYNAPTPLTVLGQQDIEATAPANVADFVNEIPSVVGSSTPANSNLSMSSGLSGLNTINLRGLGTSRTLVLLNGQRSVGSALGGQVDVNTFPQGLISGVEVVTGGASAAYGSDAVSGVVNFILDEDYTGLKASAEAGITTYGDAPTHNYDVTFGTPFADGRGHILLNGEIAIREGLNKVPRDWNNRGWYQINNPAYAPGNGEPERLITDRAGLSLATPGGLITGGALRGTYFGPEGSVGQFDFGTVEDPWLIGGDWALTQVNNNQSLDPEENRKSVFGRISYEISPALNLFAQGSYAHSVNSGQLGIHRNQGNVTIQADNAFLPQVVRNQLAEAGETSFRFGTTNADLGVRTNGTRRGVQRYVVGADGEFELFGNSARWDAYYQKGIANTRESALGIANNARLSQATDAVFAPVGNALGVAEGTIVCRSTLSDPGNGCLPLNRFGVGVADPEAVAWILGDPYRKQRFEQNVYAANLSFDAFDLPAGAISVAIGGEHRTEEVSGYVEDRYQSGWFTGNFLPSFGDYSVTEGYLELLVPVLDTLDINGAIRGTDYSTSGYVTTWKIGATFEPIDGLRFRATRSRDIRAPNLAELFTAGSTRTNTVLDPFNGNQSAPFAGTTTGNRNLTPEIADQWGVGVVFQPYFVPGFSASIDYYNIKIDDAIDSLSAQTIIDRCYEGVDQYCGSIVRGPNEFGTNLQIFESPFNFASQEASGLDFETTYRTDLGSGFLTLRGIATLYLENIVDNGLDPAVDIVGENSSGGNPEFLYRVTASYETGPVRLNLVGRGISSGTYDNTYIACTSGCPVSTATARTINTNHIDGAFYVDGSVYYDVDLGPAETTLFFAVSNLLDKDPPVVASGPAGSAYATPATNQSLYNLLGRTFRIGAEIEF
ncbi:outer membrane receptor protein involved in Fe transport [Altererythrobacter atlanticus]|nr:TonB-dependent receptor [Croceibacterium atlanticum]MBB5733489.1 outer membrane receptor protein involved in Fe transport [Croceibacterium atlanticum]